MLVHNPEERVGAEDALNDIWIVKFAAAEAVQLATVQQSMQSLQEFCATSGLQRAVFSYISEHFTAAEEEKKAREVFEVLDVNGDGQLSKEELLEGYRILLGDASRARVHVDKIMEQLDMNSNGTIDYKEFLVGNFQRSNVISLNMLKQAFDFFDEDGNGQISTAEVKRVFSACAEDGVILSIVKEADLNNDGQISFEEFVEAVNKSAL